MRTLAKLSAFGAALALLAAGAYATGVVVGPFSASAPAAAAGHAGMPQGEAPGTVTTEQGATGHGDTHGGAVAETADQPAGLASNRDGYTLTPTDPTLAAGATNDFAFRIIGPDGAPVTAFDEEHTKRLHLIVVRRDTSEFQHLHPSMDPDGTWRIPLTLRAGGSYRAFADFTPTGGPPTTLGVDLSAAGSYRPVEHPVSHVAEVDGYEVRLDGELTAGRSSPLTLSVTKDGVAVTDLQPYLGAYGHLVALRDGDLAYLHVHPDGTPDDGRTQAGPQIRFFAEVPSAATYRLFLDFQHDGTVRTAEFTVPTGPAAAGHDDGAGQHSEPQGGGH